MKNPSSLCESALPLFANEPAVKAVNSGGKLPSYIADHRARLRERFLKGGADALPDYEMLELVLFRAIPRQDVKPLARLLLDTFGSFSNVLGAPLPRLLAVKGVGQAVAVEFKIVADAARRLSRSQVKDQQLISSWDSLVDYCRITMAQLETEEFRVLFLDRKNVLITDEALGKGTVDHVPVYPREVAKRGLEVNASAVILVHNHPSGDPTPSGPDIQMTQEIDNALTTLGIKLHDHLIIGKFGEISFRAEGLI
ncbi:MAG: DNA repair protein RadC [Paracoccaceae bacterium]|nr:DNA repair protein RadC [Paracoccaceae bacterium]